MSSAAEKNREQKREREAHAVGGESLEGTKMGVRPRRPGLAGLGELRRLERRSALGGSESREQSRGEERSKNAQGVRD